MPHINWDNFMFQHTDRPTRHRIGQNPTLDDLIITNREELIQNITYHDPFGKSDHLCISFHINIDPDIQNNPQKRYRMEKGNYEMMREIFRETNWTELTALDVDTAWTNFQKIYDQAVETSIPTSLTNPNSGWRKPLWMTSKALKLTKRKYWAWQRYKNTGSYEDYQSYTHKRNKAQWERVKLRRNFENLIAREAKNKPKSFWRYAKSQTKAKEGICPMEKEDGSITNTDF